MNFKIFYGVDIVNWIDQANQAAARYGMESQEFWQWVADSCGALCRKYQDNRLVINSMICLTEWLEEVYESIKKR